MLDRLADILVLEPKTRVLNSLRKNAGACQKQRVAHLAEYHIDRERGQRQECWPVKRFAQCFGKFLVRHRRRPNGINRSANFLMFDRKIYYADHVIERDPAHPLLAASDHAANSELKR